MRKNLYTDPDFAKTYEADKKAGGADFVEMRNREIVALIAYLQRLGTDIKVNHSETRSKLNIMLKFVKNHMESITGIEIYPIISLLIFFTFFVVLFWWVFTAKKDYIKTVSNLPLDNQNQTEL